jgi:dTDP-4-dehydrorhamnose 3,5-epimerase
MQITPRKLKNSFEITLSPKVDSRGFFMRTYDQDEFEKFGINNTWVQENHSRSEQKGIIRGLHFQFPPFAETKLVRCIYGAVLDVFVDLRKDSPTFGQWDSIELSAENKKMIFIPRGFAHGFCTLTDISEVLYKVDNVYSAENECGLIWNDPDLNLNWGITNPTLSDKDKKNISFREFVEMYNALEV